MNARVPAIRAGRLRLLNELSEMGIVTEVLKLKDASAHVKEISEQHAQKLRTTPRVKLFDEGEDAKGTAARNRWFMEHLKFVEQNHMAQLKEDVELVAHQLKVRPARNQSRAKKQKVKAFRRLARNPSLGKRKLAPRCGVSIPTIARWKKDACFNECLAVSREHPGVLRNSDDELVRWLDLAQDLTRLEIYENAAWAALVMLVRGG